MNDPELQVSVVIPVYNAGPYVRKAVESALAQPETAEVLLIEDGSPDNSLDVCKQLDAEYEKVRFFTHENNANLGAGPTRNVGIENARFDYIAFLDADDFYLPDRFSAERRLFNEQPDIDGVYGACKYHVYSEDERKVYFRTGEQDSLTLSKAVSSDKLFDHLIGLKEWLGFIHLDALTIRANVLTGVGKFQALRIGQDVDFLFRLAAKSRLEAGVLDSAVAMIGVHERNRMSRVPKGSKEREKMLKGIQSWLVEEDFPREYRDHFGRLVRLAQVQGSSGLASVVNLIKACSTTDSIILDRPVFLAAIDHVTGRRVIPHLISFKNWFKSQKRR